MNRSLFRSLLVAVPLGLFALLGTTSAAPGCPFCSENRGPTLVDDFGQAAFVVLGTLTNAKIDAKSGLEGGTTDLVIEKVFKNHEYLKGKTKLTLTKYIPDVKNKYLVYCDVYKDTLDPYKGVALLPNGDLINYLDKALKLKDAPPGERLRHCFDFLPSAELDVSMDAYREFAKADYVDYKEMARKLPADTLAGWITDPKTPPYRLGLYASLLGHCGDPEKHGKLLRTMIDNQEVRNGSGIDGLLAAYIMLQPREGWSYVRGLMADEKEDFAMRYAILRTLRFYYDQRTDVLTRDQVLDGMVLALGHGDMADFAIEDMRKWKRWEMNDRVLDLAGKKTHDVPVIRRAILRYALQSAANAPPETAKRAGAYVQAQRVRDAEAVRDAEELLRLEEPAPPAEKKK